MASGVPCSWARGCAVPGGRTPPPQGRAVAGGVRWGVRGVCASGVGARCPALQGFSRWASRCALLLRGWSAGGAESLCAAWWGARAGAGAGARVLEAARAASTMVRQRWTRPTTWGNRPQGLQGVMTVRPSARAGQSSGSKRDRQRPRVEAADGSAQTAGDTGLFVCNKHLSLSPKTIGCMCVCVRVGVIEWGLLKRPF